MSLIKSNEAAFHSLSLANHGQVDIGALQATGVVTSAATIDLIVNGKELTAKTNLLITVVGSAPKVGHTLVISGTNVAATGTIQCATVLAGDTVTVNGLVYTGVAGVKSDDTEFSVDTSDIACATDLADSIDGDTRTAPYGKTVVALAAASGGTDTVTVTAAAGPDGNLVTLESSGSTLVLSGALLTGGEGVDGLHPIIKVIDATHYVIDVDFTADVSGTWTSLGAKGFFAGFIPMTAIAAGEITSITYLKPSETSHVGDATKNAYIAGIYYPFPGGIDEIVLSAGDLRMVRYSNNKPQF